MNTETLLSRLERVKPTGVGRYQPRCPAHEDRGPFLSLRELEDGRVLVHCFTGCRVQPVLSALGPTFDDLYPPRDLGYHTKRKRQPFPAADILRAIAFEAQVVAWAGVPMLAGERFNTVDRNRLSLGVDRIQAALAADGVHHG